MVERSVWLDIDIMVESILVGNFSMAEAGLGLHRPVRFSLLWLSVFLSQRDSKYIQWFSFHSLGISVVEGR